MFNEGEPNDGLSASLRASTAANRTYSAYDAMKKVRLSAVTRVSAEGYYTSSDGGVSNKADIPAFHDNASVMFFVTLYGEQSVEYSNCLFKNADFFCCL